MRIADIDILIVPGWTNSGPEHWQSRWQRKMRTARRIEQAEWDKPRLDDWVERIVEDVRAAKRPTVLVAHSCGVTAVVAAAPRLVGSAIVGALLVAPTDFENLDVWPATQGGFAAVPRQRLPFPAKVIGSSNDPYCTVKRTQELATAWGADVSIVANAGHLNTASGHGPWPEGLLTFGMFLRSLD